MDTPVETEKRPSEITAEEFLALIRDTIPMTRHLGLKVLELSWGRATIVLPGGSEWTRAGGTVNGPAIMALADTALYAAVLTQIGVEPMAVTSDLSFRFLRRPPPEDLHAEATILRRGRRQSVGEIRLWTDDPSRLVAHATGAYALPGG